MTSRPRWNSFTNWVVAGDMAKAEPKTLRCRLLHTAARITRGQRLRWLNIPTAWPWAEQLATAFARIQALPAPT